MALDPSIITNVMANWQMPASFDPISQIAKIQALKNGLIQQQVNQQALQTGALQLQQQQQEMDATSALNNAIRSNMTAGPNGAPVVDHAGVINALAGSGHGNLITKYQEGVALQAKNNADAQKVQLENASTMIDHAAREFGTATSQDDWNTAIAHLRGMGGDPAQMGIPPVFSPDAQSRVQNLAIATKDKIDNELKAREATTKEAAERRELQGQKDKEADAAMQALAGATPDNFADLRADAMAKLQAAGRAPSMVPGAWSKEGQAALNEALLTADERRQAGQFKTTADEMKRHNQQVEANAAKRLAVEQQNANINAAKYAQEYGGNAVKGWVEQVKANPDTANTVPPALRGAVTTQFTRETGLPFPKPLAGPAVTVEFSSRNALDAVKQIQEALADPEIQKRVGPILGRLGSAEQTAGMALGLTPDQEEKAQRLRTNMRYLVFQEGKALMGGRIPQNLMQQLEQSSPNVSMDSGTLKGALAGVTDAANRNLDQTFKQRYGENATRPKPAAPGTAAVPAAVTQVLKGAGPGIHTLSDGSRWMVAQDGTISKQ